MIIAQRPYTNFQLSAIGVGAIATGLADIKQCIGFILRTIPGSDPLRPLFGTDIYKYVDAPNNIAIPNIKKEIFEAIEIWETRVKVVSIAHEISLGALKFNITYRNLLDDSTNFFEWSYNDLNIVPEKSGTILVAQIPTKVINSRYNVVFLLNNEAAYPYIPKSGFSTAHQMIEWLTLNWFNYGSWYLAVDKLVLYLTNDIAKTVSLSVVQGKYLVKSALIPTLSEEYYFDLSLLLDDELALPEFPLNTINTEEGLILWLVSNWGDYGSFSIITQIVGGDFGGDFGDDFETGGPGRYLVFETNLFTTATLTLI